MSQGNQPDTVRTVIDFLVVDDQEPMLQTIRGMLRSRGYSQVVLAKSGKDALKILKEHDVKFVITDWNMPHMDGMDLLKLMRRNPDFSEIPVLMVSDEASKEKFFYALEEEVDGFQLKPFVESELATALNTIVKKRSSQNPIQKELSAIRRLKLVEKYEDAIVQGKALLDRADNPDLIFVLAECHYQLGQFDQAGKLLERLLKERPNGKVLHMYGRIKMAEKNFTEALEYLQKANALNPLNTEREIDILESLLELGQEDKAAAAFETVMRKKPTDINLAAMGKTYLKHGMISEASKALNKAAEPIPEVIGTFNNYAMELRKQGKFKESIQQYLKCLKVVPNHPLIMVNLSRAYMEAHQPDKAIETLEKLIKKHPDFENGRKLLALILKKMEQEKKDLAAQQTP